MKEVDFYFDFASPNAYLSLMAGKELEDKLGFKFNIKLALLGGIFKLTNNQPPMVAFAGIKNKLDYFIPKHKFFGLPYGLNLEILRVRVLRNQLPSKKNKEHVTFSLSKKINLSKIKDKFLNTDFSKINYSIDHTKDYIRIKKKLEKFKINDTWEKIIKYEKKK